MFMTRFPFGSARKVQDARGISRAVPVALRFAWESFSRRQRWGLLASAVFLGFCLFGFAYSLNFSIRNPPPYATGLLRWLGPSVWIFHLRLPPTSDPPLAAHRTFHLPVE